MRREDLGFVVSRILAIFLVVNASGVLSGVLSSLRLPKGTVSQSYLYESLAYPGFMLGIAWLLWFNADRFAPKGSGDETSPFDTGELRSALFACVGFYFLVGGLSSIGRYFAGSFILRDYLQEASFVGDIRRLLPDGIVQVIIGGIVMLKFGNYFNSGKLGAAKGKAAELWRVGDPEEMKDD
jgi:hypothetical protein